MSGITIGIPFHSGLAYLRSAIESVRAQSHSGWRLLICDDSLPDEGAQRLVETFGDERITCLRNDGKLGMVGNWNRQLDLAGTELVTLLHADDRLGPGYVELMLGLATRHPEATAYFCAAEIIGTGGEPRFSLADRIKALFVPRGRDLIRLEGQEGVAALMAGNFIMCPTLCFRRSRLGARRFAPEWKQVQDLDLTVQLLMDGDLLLGSREAAYFYRRHAQSATARQSENLLRFDEECRLFDSIARRCAERGWERAARISRRKTIVKLHLGYHAARDLCGLRLGRASRKLRFLVERW